MEVTLLITRDQLPEDTIEKAITGIPEPFSDEFQINLFFLDRGVYLADNAFPHLDIRQKIACAHSRNRHHLPPFTGDHPARDGGLANLGEMIGRSRFTLSLPNLHWPSAPDDGRHKSILVLLPDPLHLTEGLRLATGLAGCDHRLTIRHPEGISFPADGKIYQEALTALGSRFDGVPAGKIFDFSGTTPLWEVILQV
ncbi:MAG: hypothetical protein HQL52_08565 [Magnetococcales bacterium]|nr:hypothetical protein [Magnetococcales bacterium]